MMRAIGIVIRMIVIREVVMMMMLLVIFNEVFNIFKEKTCRGIVKLLLATNSARPLGRCKVFVICCKRLNDDTMVGILVNENEIQKKRCMFKKRTSSPHLSSKTILFELDTLLIVLFNNAICCPA